LKKILYLEKELLIQLSQQCIAFDEGRDSSEGRSNPIGGGSSWPSRELTLGNLLLIALI